MIIPTADPLLFPGKCIGCSLIHGFTGSPRKYAGWENIWEIWDTQFWVFGWLAMQPNQMTCCEHSGRIGFHR
jgi:hypothetical protein